MGVTNGFLKLSRSEFEQLSADQAAFADRAHSYDESRGYLDMDKAGYELLYMLKPSFVDPLSPDMPSPYPNIAAVLSGGDVIFPDLDLGYGPACIIADDTLQNSIPEFDALKFDEVLALAMDEVVSELLMVELNEEEFRQYHWAYLQSLGDFVRESVGDNAIVLRY